MVGKDDDESIAIGELGL